MILEEKTGHTCRMQNLNGIDFPCSIRNKKTVQESIQNLKGS